MVTYTIIATMANIKRIFLHGIVWIFNVIYSMCRFCGKELIPLTIEDVIKPLAQDEKEEILQQGFNEPIRLILEGCNDISSRMTGFQRFQTLQMIRQNVKTCTEVRREVNANPDILNTPVDGPIVIIGPNRSGTTMLQRLLACDPQFMSPMLWEMLKPTPPGRPENWRNTERYRMSSKIYDLVTAFVTDRFQAMHSLGLDANEECVVIFGPFFIHFLLSTIPDFRKWRNFMIHCPKYYQRKAYEYYKMTLQCLFYKNLDNGKKLLLKAPSHSLFLETYREILPNAKFIFTYRHIGTMIASLSSFHAEYARVFGYKVDKDFIGKDKWHYFVEVCNRAVDSFKKMEKESLFTIGYTELTKDPMDAVRRIYSHFNLNLTPEVEASMQRHLVDNPQNKHGLHEYNMEEYGIYDADIKREFKHFLDYFKDSSEILI